MPYQHDCHTTHGESLFKVIDHNNPQQLDRLDSLPMKFQTGGLRVCSVAITGGIEPTSHNSETSRPKVYAQRGL
jgi:hypothetical protein